MEFKSFGKALRENPLLGFCSMYPAPGIIERIGQDWDWCWIDAQHGQWGIDSAFGAVRACNLAGIFALVRVPGQDPGMIGKVLDTACHAVMVPMVQDRAQAEAVVEAARFAPLGRRSYGGRRPIDLFGRDYSHREQPQPLVVCQVESPEAVGRAGEIASVEGVDALFFGPDDMAVARGMPMDRPRPEGCFDRELVAVAEAARAHGRIAGGVFRSLPEFLRAVELGYHLVVCSGDVPLLTVNSRAESSAFRDALGDRSPREASGPASMY